MSFYLKYELSRLLHADGAKTFQAVEKATRRNVLLHLVDKSSTPELVGKVKRLQAGQDRDLLEVGEFAGSYYVVTDPIEEFAGLEGWLDRKVSKVGGVGSHDPQRRPAEDSPPPKLYEGPDAATQTRPRAPAAAEPPAPPARPITSPTFIDVQPSRKVQEEAGEFTRLFGEPSKATAKPRQPTPIPVTPAARVERIPSVAADEPGEFTRLFGEPHMRQGLTQPPVAPPPPPAKIETKPVVATVAPPEPARIQKEPTRGEFTRMFAGAGSPTPIPAAPPAPRTPGGTPTDDGSGEFTKMFGGAPPAREPAPRATPPPPAGGGDIANGSGEFTKLFGGPTAKAEEPQVKLKPAAPSKEGDIQKSSGEFTRLFGPGGNAAPPPAKPVSGPSPALSPSPLEGPLGGANGAPGDFTLMFGGGSAGSAPTYGSAPPPPARPPAASFGEGLVGDISGDEALAADKGPKVSKSSKPFQAPGEFTRMFGPSDPNQRPAEDFIPAARPGGGEGYASGLFRNPHSEPRPQVSAAAPGSLGQPQQAPAPGDYTMTFERGGAAPAPLAPAAQPRPPQAAITPVAPVSSKPSKTMLIALLIAVLVAGLSLGAAVYLFLNRSAGDAGEAPPPAVEQPAEPGSN